MVYAAGKNTGIPHHPPPAAIVPFSATLWPTIRRRTYLMPMTSRLAAVSVAALGLAALALAPARAQTTFTASLNGAQEPSASTATGTGFVFLNAAQTQITVDLSWTGLTGGADGSHIHGPGAPGASGPVLFPFTGVPAAASGSIPEQTFAITAAQLSLSSGRPPLLQHSYGTVSRRGDTRPNPTRRAGDCPRSLYDGLPRPSAGPGPGRASDRRQAQEGNSLLVERS